MAGTWNLIFILAPRQQHSMVCFIRICFALFYSSNAVEVLLALGFVTITEHSSQKKISFLHPEVTLNTMHYWWPICSRQVNSSSSSSLTVCRYDQIIHLFLQLHLGRDKIEIFPLLKSLGITISVLFHFLRFLNIFAFKFYLIHVIINYLNCVVELDIVYKCFVEVNWKTSYSRPLPNSSQLIISITLILTRLRALNRDGAFACSAKIQGIRIYIRMFQNSFRSS